MVAHSFNLSTRGRGSQISLSGGPVIIIIPKKNEYIKLCPLFFIICEFNLTLEISQTAKGTFLHIRLKCVFPTEQLASCFCHKTHTGRWYLLIIPNKIHFSYNVFRKEWQKIYEKSDWLIWFSFINLKNIKLRKGSKPGTITHTRDPSFYKADAGELQVQGNPGLHTEILCRPRLLLVNYF